MERKHMGMTPELQRYYEDRLSMCSSDAWKELMKDVQVMLDATNTLSGVTVDNLNFKQGEVSMMRWMLSIASASEDSYDRLMEKE